MAYTKQRRRKSENIKDHGPGVGVLLLKVTACVSVVCCPYCCRSPGVEKIDHIGVVRR
jgi:hypothetical protein